jgi:hypothetical protein
MEDAQWAELAHTHGILPQAIEDVAGRLFMKFDLDEDSPDPDPAAVDTWLRETLRREAPHLFRPPAVSPPLMADLPGWLSPSERLTRWRQTQPPPVPRRPQPFTPTPAQQAQLEALPVLQRLTVYRSMQEEAQRG